MYDPACCVLDECLAKEGIAGERMGKSGLDGKCVANAWNAHEAQNRRHLDALLAKDRDVKDPSEVVPAIPS